MALLFTGILISYMDRGNLSVAAPAIMKEFGFAPARMGVLLSAFFWTYSLFQIPAGFLVDRYGIKWSYFTGLLLWSLASAAMGLVAGFWQMVALRMVLGFGEAIAPVASIAYVKRNFAENEQGLPTGIYIGGALVGPAIGTFAGGALLDPLGWRMLFLAVGLLGCLWLVPWAIFAPSGREDGRATAPAAQENASAKPEKPLNGRALIAHPMFWAVTLGAFFYSYYWYFILTWVPSYLVNELGYSNLRMGATLGLPLAGTAVTSLIAGAGADRVIRRTGAAALEVRKAFVAGGFALACTIIGVATLPPGASVLPLFLVSMCGMGFGVSNYWALTHLIAPERLIGRVLGYQNTIAQLAGVVAPIATGILVGAEKRFQTAIVVAGLSPLVAGAALLLWLRARHIESFHKLTAGRGV
jgi:MFS family permease